MKLPRVDRRRVGGTVYKYHRVTRAKLPSDVPEDHPAFIKAWTEQEAASGAPRRIAGPQGTLAALCGDFLGALPRMDMSDDYRRVIRRHVEQIAEKYGPAVARNVKADHIEADLDKLGANPARQRRKAWRQLYRWAKRAGHVSHDPVTAVAAPSAPKTDGHVAWNREEIERFRNHWPIETAQRFAFELTYWTAARRTDAAKMNRRQIDYGGVLVYRQGKTSNPAHVPIFCALPAYADRQSHAYLMACIDAHRPEMMFVVTKFGKPRSPKAFGAWLTEAAQAAKVYDRTPHGLRKSRLAQIAEDGGSVGAIMSWGGHVTMSEAQHYIESANRRKSVMGEQVANPAQDLTALHKTAESDG
ncbi:tyrosine-type recombinase/integrase [Citreimonas sp.]|uniref:tyrosine-type recombinase/integrase n=1 Tax=Citreimonas sp. TaxID=3036715 RepID=UPI0040582EE8